LITDSQTSVYCSVSARPGIFGSLLYGHFFEAIGLNAVYIPREAPRSAAELIAAVRTLRLAGCSVSMPLKRQVVSLLDAVEGVAARIRSVNTIVRVKQGRSDRQPGDLVGYNTDVYGCTQALRGVVVSGDVVVYGTGGAAVAAVEAARQAGASRIFVAGRDPIKAAAIAMEGRVECATTQRETSFLINATPASCEPISEDLFSWAEKSRGFLDMVVSPRDTPLVAMGRASGKQVIPGWVMSMHQFREQFRLYTDVSLNLVEIRSVILSRYCDP
jgi:shikimate dehydrogenase